MESDETSAVDKTALQILASSVGQILGEHSKIHQFVKLAAERPTGINVDRAKRTFDSLPVYQRKRVAETAEGQAHKHKTSMTMSGILGRLGGDAKPRADHAAHGAAAGSGRQDHHAADRRPPERRRCGAREKEERQRSRLEVTLYQPRDRSDRSRTTHTAPIPISTMPASVVQRGTSPNINTPPSVAERDLGEGQRRHFRERADRIAARQAPIATRPRTPPIATIHGRCASAIGCQSNNANGTPHRHARA